MTNREIDALVADKVMGLRTRPRPWSNEWACLQEAPGKPWRIMPKYSESISDAFLVVEKMREKGFNTFIGVTAEGYAVAMSKELNFKGDGEYCELPKGICLSALRAVGVEV